MVFSSAIFLFAFLPITLVVYYLLKGSARNYWLLLVSLVFFAWGQLSYLWIILVNVAANYAGAMLITKMEKHKKAFLVLTIAVNLALLFYFKYFDFVLSSIESITHAGIEPFNIILPIGISFFTFQGLSYVIDVYRGTVPVQKNIFKVALYIMLFPQLIAGPIVRYSDVASEIDKRKENIDDIVSGIERFIMGLAKKAVIANTMAALVDSVWEQGSGNSAFFTVWLCSIAYTLQIYFDFSGYSDMAIGLGRMFGFHFNENFNLPYISASITEFWRRWHISLSGWFRDYVYIPLGGNRKRVYFNLSAVFLLTGIWHGAAWHFVIWGIYNGAFILIERLLKRKGTAEKKNALGQTENGVKKLTPGRLIKGICAHFYCLMVVNLGWVIFRADTFKDALKTIAIMFRVKRPGQVLYSVWYYLDGWVIFVLVCGIIFSSPLPRLAAKAAKKKLPEAVYDTSKALILLLLFAFAIMRVVSGTYNPFIYFQF